MSIIADTTDYEAWLAGHMPLIAEDLASKHKQMAKEPFPFFRATFYRWARRWPELCGALCDAPAVLAVGDIHTENFGVWRDAEARLAWGVNDVDEALPLPYTQDLTRLATSAWLAHRADDLHVGPGDACAAILGGYREGLAAGGRPFVLAEDHGWLREAALKECKNPATYWQKLQRLPDLGAAALPAAARELLAAALPAPGIACRVIHRVAGLGSLGRQRWALLGVWNGGCVAREIKALAPSAWCWATGDCASPIQGAALLERAVRSPDPTQRIAGAWVLRRLAPEYVKVEFTDVENDEEQERLLRCMGWELANIHLGDPAACQAIARDLERRGPLWLHTAAQAMAGAVLEDWEAWRDHYRARAR